jgi:hypothetical protein
MRAIKLPRNAGHEPTAVASTCYPARYNRSAPWHKLNAMKGGMEVKLHPFLTLTMYGSE